MLSRDFESLNVFLLLGKVKILITVKNKSKIFRALNSKYDIPAPELLRKVIQNT